MIVNFLEKNKSRISSYLEEYFSIKENELSLLGAAGRDTLKRLLEFTINGKMIRGTGVFLGYLLFNNNQPDKVLPAAAAVELFQSALLIHDDIMDKDEVRRGNPSVYFQYQRALESKALPDTLHTGKSLAICAGDIAFFLGYELLGILRPHELGEAIVRYASQELSKVALAQMIDVRRGIESTIPDEEEIITLYRFKTGRYTFSLPLWIGARLGGTEENNLAILEKLGELLGILFQIKDDELGLFGDEQVLGKPVGSDLREGKKTLHLTLIHTMGSGRMRQELDKINKSGEISQNQITLIKDEAERLGIRAYIETKYLKPMTSELKLLQNSLTGASPRGKELLGHLIDFVTTRKK